MPSIPTIALWVFILAVMLMLGSGFVKYFWATSNDEYRSNIRRCKNCSSFKSESFFEGYCGIWKNTVLKKSVCTHYNAKNIFIELLEKFGH